jgi:glycosyltransferase involved in cell wall biosynthesis
VVPSLWLENSPLVIHEAYQAGVPVIGSRIGGIADLVRDDWNGWLVEPGSAGALAAVLRRAIEQPACLQEFADRLPAVKSIAEDCLEWEARYAEVLSNQT